MAESGANLRSLSSEQLCAWLDSSLADQAGARDEAERILLERGICPKCGENFVTHAGDGACIE